MGTRALQVTLKFKITESLYREFQICSNFFFIMCCPLSFRTVSGIYYSREDAECEETNICRRDYRMAKKIYIRKPEKQEATRPYRTVRSGGEAKSQKKIIVADPTFQYG
jgi:hypothetical protein